jgi:tryptophan halogenase
VEPLEASALQVIINQSRTLGDLLVDSECAPPPTAVEVYDRFIGQHWDDVRDFLGVHYRFNTRLETPFWQTARAETALHDAAPIVEYYRENGPSALAKSVLFNQNNPYGLEGYLAMLVGQKVPHAKPHQPSPAELKRWREHLKDVETAAKRAFGAPQALEVIRRPAWNWN